MKKPNILLVDDEVDFVEMISMRLRASGYEVAALYEGESVLNTISHQRPDLVILDLMLPKVDGYTVCAAMKKNADFRNIPVIILTAKDPSSEAQMTGESAADACLIKPFDPKELLDKIKELIKKSS